MKSFVIYVKGNNKSEQYARTCLQSCHDKFNAELFAGVTPSTLDMYDKEYFNLRPMENSRAQVHKEKRNEKFYNTKKSCFLNHVRLWHKCVKLNKPIAVIEHDAFCLRPWNNDKFEDLLILNIKSAFKQPVFKDLKKQVASIKFEEGVNQYTDSPLTYKMENKFFKDSLLIPGTAAYAITPKGAKKLINLLQFGWDQSDYFINTRSVKIEYVNPEYFTFKLPNLQMSHGIKE